ncbi:RNA-binding S4 domain-containing protein [Chromobacterium violaceum]|uniref:Heat shock protein 15 n=2 Tax=Chromobacterium violaceum TaxID=536 RepID=A0A1R0MSD1_CHRVL|nr:S4 domain-containing protein [Chromobacterium violaceum]AAQ60455.1 probable ribosome-associated heat shock protein Hsp15 [Chromobacterium violaceum ATCC 12472]ATP30719.1 RNA-binding protein [Chromobacterium violaceum]ATP34627.1 RNA-binding protein [Chromobacterium violaceum]KJH68108.1 tRNA synthetase RNA-binding protein [Chromobacterium violaceum]MBA8736438.1 RNA-binding protein [Chromobacterium violaceum]
MARQEERDDDKVRLDKWLWAARFFKTRQLAHEALELGRVLVNGERVKASRVVKEGDRLFLRLNQLEYDVEVLQLATQRRPAKEAALMYREDAASIAAREERTLLLKAERASFPHGDGRPTKKARREISRFKSSF